MREVERICILRCENTVQNKIAFQALINIVCADLNVIATIGITDRNFFITCSIIVGLPCSVIAIFQNR